METNISAKVVWVLHHYADPPDGHWTGTYDLHKFLAKRGHRVTIFSSSFSHYSRKDNRLQKSELYKEKSFNGVCFVFIKTTPYFRNDWRRVLNMLTYAFRTYIIGLRQEEKPDVIIGSTPHPFCAFAAFLLSRRLKTNFFLEVHDLWPQFFIEIGAMSKWNPIVFGLKLMEKFLFTKADKILTLWPGMDAYAQNFGIPKERITWLPLGVDCERLSEIKGHKRTEKNNFSIMYRGRFGFTQDISVILRAAGIIQKKGFKNLNFIIVGEGPEKLKLVKHVKENGLMNVQFQDFSPKHQINNDMSRADLLLGSLPDLPHFQKYGMISTKLLDYLSAKRPVVFSTNIKNHLVSKSGAGIVVPSGNSSALAEAIIKLYSMDPEERFYMAENGIKYLKDNHDLEKISRRLELML